MQQHDVQEFCMQLFDAIEASFEQNGTYGAIADLYQGSNTDFVMCLHCGYESKKDARFFDLQLTVKNEFDNVQNSSVEQALSSFLNIEKLEGDNKYACPTCDEKRDADKGTKFVKLPQILMLQLQRFTLDMQTFNRKKLNDLVSFPLVLNMNHFLDSETKNQSDLLKKLIDENPLKTAQRILASVNKKPVSKPNGTNGAKIVTDSELTVG